MYGNSMVTFNLDIFSLVDAPLPRYSVNLNAHVEK